MPEKISASDESGTSEIMTYSEVMEYVEELGKYGSVPGLANMKNLCEKLGNPERELSFIHVAGTNGKGSVCAFIFEILRAAGYRVGRYISPVIFDYRERIQVGGRIIGKKDLCRLMTQLREICRELVSEGKPHPTAFEIETAIAFQYFKEKEGGRILGVSLRGTDYFNKPYEHPVQPTIEQAIEVTHKVIEEQKCKWIYLAAEDVHIIDAYEQEFGECLFYVREVQAYGDLKPGENITSHSFDRENDRYLRGMEYMMQKALLTKCNCLIGGRTSGNVAVMVWKPKYDYTYFWNLGRYGIDDVIDRV